MNDTQKKGRVTIPTDLDVVPETLEILKKWGADAIRDCDGTDFPQQLRDADAKIYSTYYTTRKDNAWAKANPDEIQQCYIMTGFYTAHGDTVTIPLMKGISPELMEVNTRDDITRWWEVMDRTTGQPVPPSQWSYADGCVTVQAVPFHEYTVSFLAYLIWDPVHMYNATTNGWTNFEHQITFDVRQPKTHKYSMERLRKFIQEHPYVNVIRYTTFFHQFTLIFDELKREKYVDWYGYSASVSPYILEQFEKLAPTHDELVGIFSVGYTVPEVETAIDNLIGKEYVVYLKRSNNYLRLKQTSGVDIQQKIHDMMASPKGKASVKDTLNKVNFDSCVYPSRYNDEREMTRYFSFVFVNATEVSAETNWSVKSENIPGDGVVYGIIPHSAENLSEIKEVLLSASGQAEQAIFVVPNQYTDISEVIAEFNAVSILREAAIDDKVLFDEYEVIYEDLREIINAYIKAYTQPEKYMARYIYQGKEHMIGRKASLTGLISDICDKVFSQTPVINNEAINKDDITSIAYNSRSKIISGLLRNELEKGLGLTGSGQEVSIMRSTLIRTGVLVEEAGIPKINLCPDDPYLENTLTTIVEFIREAHQKGKMNFGDLYYRLTSAEHHIGMRKGLIPIYLAAVMHEFRQSVLITDRFGQVPTSTDTLLQINAEPSAFFITYLDWNPEKELFVSSLAELFRDHVIEAEKANNAHDYVVFAMRRWYMSLPKYSKEIKKTISGDKVDKRYLSFARLLRQNTGAHELLFQRLPEAFGYAAEFTPGVVENVAAAKKYFDDALSMLKKKLVKEVKELFAAPHTKRFGMTSLASVIKDWCESLDRTAYEQLFPDGTEKCLALFQSMTNDEDTFIARLAKICTDLRLEDWDDNTHSRFSKKLNQYKATAEQYHSVAEKQSNDHADSNYQVTFVEESGVAITKRFDRVEISKRGKLLLNAITSDIDSMGHSITEQEKRQILMEVLKKLC